MCCKSITIKKVNENKLIVVDELKFDTIKTKNMVAVLKNLNANKALVVLNEKDDTVIKSANNIPNVQTALTSTINVYDILKHDTMVVTKAAVATIEEVYAEWQISNTMTLFESRSGQKNLCPTWLKRNILSPYTQQQQRT